MKMFILNGIFLLFLTDYTRSSVLPVDKCKLEDSACMITAFQNAMPVFFSGLPEIGVEVLDVMELDYVEFDLSGLKFTLSDGRLKGHKNATIDDVKWDTEKRRFDVIYHLDSSIKGHYTAGGSILVLPITGDGQMKLKLKNMQIHFYIEYDVEKAEDGKDHIVLKKYDFDFDVRENAHFELSNLFNGNKELSKIIHSFLNENWKQVVTEFGRPIMDATAKKFFKNINIFFEKNSLEDIAIL